jgi:PAS domain-containing protein
LPHICLHAYPNMEVYQGLPHQVKASLGWQTIACPSDAFALVERWRRALAADIEELKRAEDGWRESEERFRLLAERRPIEQALPAKARQVDCLVMTVQQQLG